MKRKAEAAVEEGSECAEEQTEEKDEPAKKRSMQHHQQPMTHDLSPSPLQNFHSPSVSSNASPQQSLNQPDCPPAMASTSSSTMDIVPTQHNLELVKSLTLAYV